jgi:hypothetical protein
MVFKHPRTMRNAFIFAAIAFGGMMLVSMCNTPVHNYVGTVISVASWDGIAQVRTRGIKGQDTVIQVLPMHRERFVVGQVLTAWSGGDLLHDASTSPPR